MSDLSDKAHMEYRAFRERIAASLVRSKAILDKLAKSEIRDRLDKAEARHRAMTLYDMRRLKEWMERAEAAEAECGRLRRAVSNARALLDGSDPEMAFRVLDEALD